MHLDNGPAARYSFRMMMIAFNFASTFLQG